MQEKFFKILIPAVGGQGGGLLTEWLLQALELENYNVQSIGLPGLAQRGGSTTYYIEAYHNEGDSGVIFSQYPMPGDIDLILSQEFLELGRMLEKGFGSDKTVIITSTHRMYSTEEKLPIASGIYEEERLHKFADEFSDRFIGLNVLDVARQNGMNDLASNAILFGALSGSRAIPIEKGSYEKAIEKAGVSVGDNLRAFEIGFKFVSENSHLAENSRGQDEKLPDETEYLKLSDIESIKEAEEDLYRFYPEYLHEFIKEALYRLTDYQGFWYTEKYLDALRGFRDIELGNTDKEFKLSEYVIKNLALHMSYEDGIRVSELKIRDKRFERIKKDMQIRDDQVFEVVDYLKPDAEEVYGLLPNIAVLPALAIVNSKIFRKIWPKKEPLSVAQKPKTTSIFGFLRIWFLTKLKFMRPVSYRYVNEHRVIGIYLDAVKKYSRIDYELGVLVAKSGSIIKGYGRVRRRTIDSFIRLIENVLEKTYESENENQNGIERTKKIFEDSLKLISETEDGIDQAEKMVSDP